MHVIVKAKKKRIILERKKENDDANAQKKFNDNNYHESSKNSIVRETIASQESLLFNLPIVQCSDDIFNVLLVR